MYLARSGFSAWSARTWKMALCHKTNPCFLKIDMRRWQRVRLIWLYISQLYFAFLLTETLSRSMKTPKRTRPIYSHLDRTSLVNRGFFYMVKKRTFSCGTNGGILTRLASQSERRIRFILPARRFSHIITLNIDEPCSSLRFCWHRLYKCISVKCLANNAYLLMLQEAHMLSLPWHK